MKLKHYFSLLTLLVCLNAQADLIYLTTTGVNLRKGPDNKKKVILSVPAKEQLSVLEKTNAWWWKVEYKGQQGYMSTNFITISYPKSALDFIKKNPVGAIIGTIVFLLLLLISKRSKSKPALKKVKPRPSKKKTK